MLNPRFVGQIYYTLLKERQDRGIKDVAISRLEQMSPFPYDLVSKSIASNQDCEPRALIRFLSSHPTWTSTRTRISFGVRYVHIYISLDILYGINFLLFSLGGASEQWGVDLCRTTYTDCDNADRIP
jgi:hypothetical protein